MIAMTEPTFVWYGLCGSVLIVAYLAVHIFRNVW